MELRRTMTQTTGLNTDCVLAIVRAVEHKYGVIKEFKCFRVCLIQTMSSVLLPIALGRGSFDKLSGNY